MQSDPWAIPPGPSDPDALADTTYAAVGRALSRWEDLEYALACLSAAFTGHSLPAAVDHGDYVAATMFTARADAIENAFRQFIIRHPDQHLEGDFQTLIGDIRRLSSRRNDIAHGVVRPCWDEKETTISDETAVGYVLVPAGHNTRNFANGRPSYIFGSADINRYGTFFKGHQGRVSEFRRRIALLLPS